MATSLTPSLPESNHEPIPASTLAFFRERLRTKLYQLVLREFVKQERAGLLKRADLAKRLGRKPAQITRWLNAPSNWTLDTISDLLVGLGIDPDITGQPMADAAPEATRATPQSARRPVAKNESAPAREAIPAAVRLRLVPTSSNAALVLNRAAMAYEQPAVAISTPLPMSISNTPPPKRLPVASMYKEREVA